MSLTNRNLKHEITYWGPQTSIDGYGVASMAAPVLIKGHWEDSNQEVQSPTGSTFISRAVVYADRDLIIGGYLAQGDQTAYADPHAVDSAWEIQAYGSRTDIRNLAKERKAFL
jgi:hypothetical protein